MYEEEKQILESQINDKLSRLQEIKQEQQEIKKRADLINEYEKALSSLKHCKNGTIVTIILVIAALGLLSYFSIPIVYSLVIIVITCLADNDNIITYLKDYWESKKSIKENKAQYEEAKEREEKDKELSLTLSNEYTKIEQDILLLQYRLSRFKKIEAMEKLGYQLELMASKLNEQYFCVVDNRNKEAYEQLWEQYLIESKDYSKVHLYNSEVDSTQVLVKKL